MDLLRKLDNDCGGEKILHILAKKVYVSVQYVKNEYGEKMMR